MMDMDIFQLLYNHLEEQHYNNICQNAKQDANYLKAAVLENELNAAIRFTYLIRRIFR